MFSYEGYGPELRDSGVHEIRLFDYRHHEMKIARTVLLIFALLASLAMPIFFLTVRHFHMESETAEWLVSLWPRSLGEVALEDRRAAADMVVTYGVLAAASMLTYTVIGWTALIVWRIFKRGAKKKELGSPASGDFGSG